MLIRPKTCLLVSRIAFALFVMLIVPLVFVGMSGVKLSELELREAPNSSLVAKTMHVGHSYFTSQMHQNPVYVGVRSREEGKYVLSNYTAQFMLAHHKALDNSSYRKDITSYLAPYGTGLPALFDKYAVGGEGNDTTLIAIDNNITGYHQKKAFVEHLERWGGGFKFTDSYQEQVWEKEYETYVTGTQAMTEDLAEDLKKYVAIIGAVIVPVGFVVLCCGFWVFQHRVSGLLSGLSCAAMGGSPHGMKNPERLNNGLIGSVSDEDDDDTITVGEDGQVTRSKKPSLLERFMQRKSSVVFKLPVARAALFCTIVVLCGLPFTFLNVYLIHSAFKVSTFAILMLALVGPITCYVAAACMFAQIWFLCSSPVVQKRATECLQEASQIASLLVLDSTPSNAHSPYQSQNSLPRASDASRSSRYRDVDDAQPTGSSAQSLPEGSTLILLDTTILPGLHVGISDDDVTPYCNGSLPSQEAKEEVCNAVSTCFTIRCVYDAINTYNAMAISIFLGSTILFVSLFFVDVQCLKTASLSAAIGMFFTIAFTIRIATVLSIAMFHVFFIPDWDKNRLAAKLSSRRPSSGALSSTTETSSVASTSSAPRSNASTLSNVSVTSYNSFTNEGTNAPTAGFWDRVGLFWLRGILAHDNLQHFILRSTTTTSIITNVVIVGMAIIAGTLGIYSLTTIVPDVGFYNQVPRHAEHVVNGRALYKAIGPSRIHPMYMVFEAPNKGGVCDTAFWYNVTESLKSVSLSTGVPLDDFSTMTVFCVGSVFAPYGMNNTDFKFLWNRFVDKTSTLIQVAIYPTFDPESQEAVSFFEKMGPLCTEIMRNATGNIKFVGWYGGNSGAWATMEASLPLYYKNICCSLAVFAVLLPLVLYLFAVRRTREAFNFIVAGLSATSALRKQKRWRRKLAFLAVKTAALIIFLAAFVVTISLAITVVVFQTVNLGGSFPALQETSGVTWYMYPLGITVILVVVIVLMGIYLDEVYIHCAIGQILLVAMDIRDTATQPIPSKAAAEGNNNPTAAEALLGNDMNANYNRTRMSSLSSLNSEPPANDSSRLQLLRASNQLLDANDLGTLQYSPVRTRGGQPIPQPHLEKPVHQLRKSTHTTSNGVPAKSNYAPQAGGGRQPGAPHNGSRGTSPSSSAAIELEASEEHAIREAYYARWMTSSLLHHIQRTLQYSAYPTSTLLVPCIVYSVLFIFLFGYGSLLFADTIMINELGVMMITACIVMIVFVIPLFVPVMRRLLQLV